MSQSITVSKLVDDEYPEAKQEYSLDQVLSKNTAEGLGFSVYQSSNFFGYPVTFGKKAEVIKDTEEEAIVRVSVKATVCSDEDTYDPEHGIVIVLGRLLLEEEDGVTLKGSDKEAVIGLANQLALHKAEELADYLYERSATLEFIEMHNNQIKRTLKEKFSKFK